MDSAGDTVVRIWGKCPSNYSAPRFADTALSKRRLYHIRRFIWTTTWEDTSACHLLTQLHRIHVLPLISPHGLVIPFPHLTFASCTTVQHAAFPEIPIQFLPPHRQAVRPPTRSRISRVFRWRSCASSAPACRHLGHRRGSRPSQVIYRNLQMRGNGRLCGASSQRKQNFIRFCTTHVHV